MPSELSNFLTVDLVVLAVLIAGSFLYTFMVSRGKLLAILVSTYMAYTLVQFAPFLDALGNTVGLDAFILRIILFGIVFLAVLLVLSNVVFQTPVGAETLGVAVAFAFSVLQIGFLIAVFFSFLPSEILETFSPLLQTLFASPLALFAWAAVPVFFLIYLGYKINARINNSDFDDDYDPDYEDWEENEE